MAAEDDVERRRALWQSAASMPTAACGRIVSLLSRLARRGGTCRGPAPGHGRGGLGLIALGRFVRRHRMDLRHVFAVPALDLLRPAAGARADLVLHLRQL